jgi:hypothetical protein
MEIVEDIIRSVETKSFHIQCFVPIVCNSSSLLSAGMTVFPSV